MKNPIHDGGASVASEGAVIVPQEIAAFAAYCRDHPSERFWQALRNWSGHNFILAASNREDRSTYRDTFYWRTKEAPSLERSPATIAQSDGRSE